MAAPILTGALWTFGIRHLLSDPFCPWQNERIERFFGTMKERINHVLRVWYNHIRPHQGSTGLTPAEAWIGRTSSQPPRFFSAWKRASLALGHGILAGFGRPT